jgi:hypothetical protein
VLLWPFRCCALPLSPCAIKRKRRRGPTSGRSTNSTLSRNPLRG